MKALANNAKTHTRLKKLVAASGVAMAAGIAAGAEVLIDKIKESAPVKTGAFRDGIKIIVKDSTRSLVGIDPAEVPHAPDVEFGNDTQQPNPVFRSGISKNKNDIREATGKGISKEIKRANS